MSKVLGHDQSGYRSFKPEYEYPVERRQILRVSEDTVRGTENADTHLSDHSVLVGKTRTPQHVFVQRFTAYR